MVPEYILVYVRYHLETRIVLLLPHSKTHSLLHPTSLATLSLSPSTPRPGRASPPSPSPHSFQPCMCLPNAMYLPSKCQPPSSPK